VPQILLSVIEQYCSEEQVGEIEIFDFASSWQGKPL